MNILKTRDIAAELHALSLTLPECSGRDCKCGQAVEIYRNGSFVLRARKGQEHVAAVAAKFERGYRKKYSLNGLPAPYTLRRPPDADARLAALEAAEVQS